MTEGEERREHIIKLLTQTKKADFRNRACQTDEGKPPSDRAGYCTASRIKPKHSLDK